mgnify:CR=1 FL=1
MIGFAGIYLKQGEWTSKFDDELHVMIKQLQGAESCNMESFSFVSEKGIRSKCTVINANQSFTSFKTDTTEGFVNGYVYGSVDWNTYTANADVAQKLNGAFNVVSFDRQTSALHIVRDRGGAKSCFYYDGGDYILFASGLRAISKSPLYVTRSINKEALWMNIAFPAPPQPLTCFKDIWSTERGTLLSISALGVSSAKYWEIPSRSVDNGLSYNDAVQQTHEALNSAVQTSCTGEAIGSTLSGGVDSAYLTALAHEANPDVEAFTFKLKDPKFDQLNEDDVATLTAQKHGIKHHVEEVDFESMMEDFSQLIKLYEQPGISLGAYFSISKIGHRLGFNNVVNGLAGDELYGGFHFFKHLEYWWLLRLASPIGQMVPSNTHAGFDKLKKISGARSIDEYYSRAFATFLDPELALLFKSDRYDALETLSRLYNPDKASFEDHTSGLLHYMFANCPNHHLYRFETFANHFGISGIYPFLDNRVIDTAFSIPSQFKVKGHKRKMVLKSAAKPWVVQPALTENKRGVGAPVKSWMKDLLASVVDEKLAALKQRDLFDADYIDHMVKTYPSAYGKKIWKLVMTELWIEEFLD